jgi:hypothetical protein
LGVAEVESIVEHLGGVRALLLSQDEEVLREKEVVEAKPLELSKSLLMANIQELFSAQSA